MNDHEVLIKGVDFDFQHASPLTIYEIAKAFGGDGYYDSPAQRVTYMLENPCMVPIDKLSKIHADMSEIGRNTEKVYGCKYIGNELYLNTSAEGAKRLSELGIHFHLRHV
jgi:hypothetical protein